MSTCNRLDLQTLGFQPDMPKISPIAAGGLLHHSVNWPLVQGQ